MNKGARTVAAILTQPWLINASYVHGMLPSIVRMVTEEAFFFEDEAEEKDPLDDVTSIQYQNEEVLIVPNYAISAMGNLEHSGPRIAQINIEGGITKHDNCGDPGSMTMRQWIQEAEADDNVIGILLNIDSPGGMVSGTAGLGQAVKNTSKPIIAHIDDGMAASAAYWVSSQAEKVYVSTENSQVGSIGTYASFPDFREYYEEMGIKIHEIYSRKSTEKNLAYRQARDGKPELMQDHLDEATDMFINAVNSGRNINMKAGDPFKGAMFSAKKAQEIGLIDGIRSVDEVYAEIINSSKTNIYV